MKPRQKRPNPKLAVAYFRMSTSKQDLSLDAQRKVVVDWAAEAGVEVVAWFEDPAKSGSVPPRRRPGLLAALDGLRTHGAGYLVVAADDRLSRNTDHAGWIATEVADAGAVVLDASNPTKDWIGMMFDRMQAQHYLHTLRKNTLRALALKKARGERVGTIPFGFRLAMDGVHVVPHPAEFKALIRILELRKSKLGGRRIAALLQAEGHRPRGKMWHPMSIQTLADRWLEGDLPVDLRAALEGGGHGPNLETIAATTILLKVHESKPSPRDRSLTVRTEIIPVKF